MTLLLHVCCGPCSIFPLRTLRQDGHEPQGLFFNPNIHPYQEFSRRLDSMRLMAREMEFTVHYQETYGLTEFLRRVVFNETGRCALCYEMRLRRTAALAKELAMDAFSTTLLYSRYQNHALIVRQAESAAAEFGIPFHYQDFRAGWQEGIDSSKEMNLYRQPYCGCIYSEQERYDRRGKKSS